jgi:NAD+ synthase
MGVLNKMNSANIIHLPKMDPELVSKEIGDFIVNEVVSKNMDGCVIGLSGGVDSTVTAALTKKAFDKFNAENSTRQLSLIGYMLPSKTNSPDDEKDAITVAEQLGIKYEIQSIEPIVNAYAITNPEAVESKYDKGNLMSRIRSNYLSTKSATENKLVVGTGNKDEDFGIGYYTLFGDGAVHMSPIAGLSKRLVREMASYLGFEELANRVPTAGLEPGQTDFKDLGYSYDTVEIVTEGMSQGLFKELLVRNNQVIDTAEKDIKMYKQSYGEIKFTSVEGIVNDIYRRHSIANAKARIICPPKPEITLNYL